MSYAVKPTSPGANVLPLYLWSCKIIYFFLLLKPILIDFVVTYG